MAICWKLFQEFFTQCKLNILLGTKWKTEITAANASQNLQPKRWLSTKNCFHNPYVTPYQDITSPCQQRWCSPEYCQDLCPSYLVHFLTPQFINTLRIVLWVVWGLSHVIPLILYCLWPSAWSLVYSLYCSLAWLYHDYPYLVNKSDLICEFSSVFLGPHSVSEPGLLCHNQILILPVIWCKSNTTFNNLPG